VVFPVDNQNTSIFLNPSFFRVFYKIYILLKKVVTGLLSSKSQAVSGYFHSLIFFIFLKQSKMYVLQLYYLV